MLTDADLFALLGYLRTVPAVDREWPAEQVGRSCHGAGLDGTSAPDAPDLTRGRLAAWKEEDLFRALREGRRPARAPAAPFACRD